MKLVFYGCLADMIGREIDMHDVDGCTIGELRRTLIANYSRAAAMLSDKRTRACIGDAFTSEDQLIAPDAVVEFLPPVSGG